MATLKWSGATSGDFTVAGNWIDTSTGSASGSGPQNGDVLYFEDNAVSVDAGLSNASTTLAGLYIGQSYTGSIGTDAAPLIVDFTGTDVPVDIGYHNGPGTPAGSPLINLSTDTGDVHVTVYNTGTSADASKAPLRLLVNNSLAQLLVYKGKVSVATGIGETAELEKITTSYDTKVSTDADVFIGPGVTLADLYCEGGDTVCECATSNTVVVRAGTLTTSGAAAKTHNVIDVRGGTFVSNNTGTISSCRMYGGTLDLIQSNKSRTITDLTMDPGSTVKVNKDNVTLTNKIITQSSDINVTYTAS